jgi:signal peptidase I
LGKQAAVVVSIAKSGNDCFLCIDDLERTHVYDQGEKMIEDGHICGDASNRMDVFIYIRKTSHLLYFSALFCGVKSESPVVVVLSGSMEPAFQRGDILFLNNAVEEVGVGDVVVFKIKDRDIPIVHRILKVHEDENGKVELLTKGDNNRVDDRGLYAPGQLWLEREDILGKATGTLRYVGMVTIALNDYPVLKYVLVGMMGLFVLTSKEG